MKNFWEKLPKPARNASHTNAGGPFFCLAPMADVTDPAFRRIICKYGKPDARQTPARQDHSGGKSFGLVFWTEFTSADGLCSIGKKKLLINLKFSKKEHPIVAQIFGANSENIKKASALCARLGFDGIDINMGCPDRAIEKQGAGTKMMQNQKLAGEIIKSAKEGAKGLPVSVKTRIGYNKDEIDTWIDFLLKQNLSALTVHLRTRKEMSKVPAHWELAKKIVTLRNKINKETKIIFNGDVLSVEDGIKKARMCECDGIMIGRAIFGNPWLFANKVPSIKQKLKVLIEHTKLFEKLLGEYKNFAVMKKHFKAYVNGWEGAKELRAKLMETKNAQEVENIIKEFLKKK